MSGGIPVRRLARFARKWDVSRCIAYFQAHTNTYAPLPFLRQKFEEALAQEGIVGIHIATRADCLPPDVIAYLAALSERTALTVELGLQTSSDQTAAILPFAAPGSAGAVLHHEPPDR